jgi:outer membrane protein
MQQLISSMPEAKRAYDTLQVFEQELNKDGQMLMTEFQTKVAAYQKDEPTLKPDIKEVRLKELEASKANIEEYKERMEQKIAAREQKLTIPIIAKAKKAVSDVAAEKGIVCVLDNSKDIVVTATCEDLLAPAKLKLGIK